MHKVEESTDVDVKNNACSHSSPRPVLKRKPDCSRYRDATLYCTPTSRQRWKECLKPGLQMQIHVKRSEISNSVNMASHKRNSSVALFGSGDVQNRIDGSSVQLDTSGTVHAPASTAVYTL